jgi:hypothetical protein
LIIDDDLMILQGFITELYSSEHFSGTIEGESMTISNFFHFMQLTMMGSISSVSSFIVVISTNNMSDLTNEIELLLRSEGPASLSSYIT